MKSNLPPWERPVSPLKRFFGAVGRLLAQTGIEWCFGILLLFFFFISPEEWGQNESLLAIQEIGRLIACTASIYLVVKIADDENLVSLGLERNRWAFPDIIAGFVITFVVLGAAFLVFLGLGWIRVSGFVWESQPTILVVIGTVVTFLICLFVGWSEELLSRGFHLQTIERGLNRFWGVLLSSILFAYFHRHNPGMTWFGLLYIFIAGLVFAYAYLKTGQLWLSMGLHAGWDFFVVVVFYGVPIRSMRIFHLMDLQVSSAASHLFVIIAEFIELVACAILIHYYVKIRNKRSRSAAPSEADTLTPKRSE
jgi:membrane protease YdiL (CAAX protease family)